MENKISILLITWKRPEHTIKSLLSALECNPHKLYIYNDGFSNNTQINKNILKTRDIIKDYSIKNQNIIFKFNQKISEGCKVGVTNAINWFFSENEYGVIVEDDILLSKLFIKFCRYYRSLDERIDLVASCNYDTIATSKKLNHRFSKHIYIWGWACSREIWKNYTPFITEDRIKAILKKSKNKSYNYKKYLNFIIKKCRDINSGLLDTWDYQLSFLCLERNLLCLVPNIPLSENIGFDSDATHTFGIKPTYVKKISHDLILDNFCNYDNIDTKADFKIENKIYYPTIQSKIKNKLVKWKRKFL